MRDYLLVYGSNGNGHPIWLKGVVPRICEDIIVLWFGECPPSLTLPTSNGGIATFGILFNSLENVLWSEVIELFAWDGRNPILLTFKMKSSKKLDN